jgi:hypothetical protein
VRTPGHCDSCWRTCSSNLEAAQASALAVGRNAEAAFSVNPNLADESAEQMQISMAEINADRVHAALRAAHGADPNWTCDWETLERFAGYVDGSSQ